MELKEVLLAIRKWNSESRNFRNDGWAQGHYKENISEVATLIESFNMKEENDTEEESYKILDDVL
jgi:hypothetical protein